MSPKVTPMKFTAFALPLALVFGAAGADAAEQADGQPSIETLACAAYGPGYVAVPGSSVCIKTSGSLQVDVYSGGRPGEGSSQPRPGQPRP